MSQGRGNTSPLWIRVALAGTILVLFAGGMWFFKDQQRQQRQEVETRLWSIAKLKAKQIAEWRTERLADAAVLVTRRHLIESARRFLSTPTDQEASEILRRLRPIKARYHFTDILLVDPQKRVRLSLDPKTMDLHYEYASTLDVAIAERSALWTPLHIGPQYPSPHLSVVAPLFSEQDAQPIGALVLISDAGQFLYPLIQSWPTPSNTAETLLVRQDGEDVLFLNELRHQKDTALKLRIPLSRADLPAAMAVAGKKGVVEGKDYRGVEVVAAILPIPDSPWFIVAKMDASEAFSVWRFRSFMILALILGAVGLVMTAGLVVQQRNLKAHYRELFQSEAALRASVEKQAVTLNAIGDAVIATDAGGRVELMNPVAEKLTGWNQGEALGRNLREVFRIINEDTRETAEDPIDRVLKEGTVVGLDSHTVLIARDGRELPIADSGAPIRDDRHQIIGVVLVFRDQTEERLTRRLMETRLSLIEYAASHTLEEHLTRALDEVGTLVESPIGFFHFLEPDPETLSLQQWSTRTLKEFCRAQGKGMHYGIEQAGVWVDCVHERKPVIHNDYASLSHKKGLPEGHAEVVRELVVPIMRKGEIVAILGVGNKPTDYTEKDVEIVSYLADVAWEIVIHKRAEDALRESEERFRTVLENLPGGVFAHDLEGNLLVVNEMASKNTFQAIRNRSCLTCRWRTSTRAALRGTTAPIYGIVLAWASRLRSGQRTSGRTAPNILRKST